MKTATNIYIFNLALADSLFLATLPFQVWSFQPPTHVQQITNISWTRLDIIN